MDIVIEYLFPIFGISADELNAARQNAQSILDQWNAEHADDPSQQYDNLQDFNNKDKWWFKTSRSIKSGASKVWGNVKTGASNLWENIKTGASNLADGLKPYMESIAGLPKFISALIKDAIHYGKTGEHLEDTKISEDDPLSGVKNVIRTASRVITFPLALGTKLFINAKMECVILKNS